MPETKPDVKSRVKSALSTAKEVGETSKGVAKTFFLGKGDFLGSDKPEDNVDYGPGPEPKAKTPAVPKRWYKSDEHLPSYKDGINYVPKTGPAILHEGEAVIPVEDNPISKVVAALGQGGKKVVQPQDSEAKGIAEKNKMVDEYKSSLQSPMSQPKKASPVLNVDKVNQGPYGSRGKEKRIDTTEMTKPLGSFKDGTDEVPQTGNYTLHEGEAVLKKKDASKMRAKKRVSGTLGSKGGKKSLAAKKGSKKTVHKTTVHRADDGGVVVQHEFEDGTTTPMKHHESIDSANDEMAKHYGSTLPATGSAQGQSPAGASDEPDNDDMAQPASFAEGGVVQKSGMAKVHEGEVVVPKDQAHKVVQNPDITIGGGAKGTSQKKFTPFAGDPPKNRPTKKQTKDEINAIRKSGIPDSDRDNWMNNPKVAARTDDSI